MLSTLLKGAMLSGSMIIAIGSQNAFLLKSGMRKNAVFTVATICFLGDVLLMSIGVWGIGALNKIAINAQLTLAILGALFLIYYGTLSFKSAIKGNSSLEISNAESETKKLTVIMGALAITFLNPHVYLDTVIVVGGVASPLSNIEKSWFLLGALISSFLWFYGLAFLSKRMSKLLSKTIIWRILDTIIAIIMFYIAGGILEWSSKQLYI